MIGEYTKYIAVFLGWALGVPFLWKRRDSLGLSRAWQPLLLGLLFSAASTAAALLFASLEGLLRGEGFRLGSISTYGVYFIAPLLIALVMRPVGKDLRKVFDAFAIYAMPSLFVLRCNCLLSGCCGGRPIGSTGLSWPTREAELVFYAVLLLVLLRREKAGAVPGTAFPLLMAVYGAFRFVEEWFRADSGGLLHLAHLWSALAVILGSGLYFELNSGRTKGPHRERGVSKC